MNNPCRHLKGKFTDPDGILYDPPVFKFTDHEIALLHDLAHLDILAVELLLIVQQANGTVNQLSAPFFDRKAEFFFLLLHDFRLIGGNTSSDARVTEPRIDGVHCDRWQGWDVQVQGSTEENIEHYEDVRASQYRDRSSVMNVWNQNTGGSWPCLSVNTEATKLRDIETHSFVQ